MAAPFTRGDVRPALKQMKGMEVVLVDTPGRGPRGHEDAVRIRECLWALRPDEVHFVLPAGLSTAAGLRAFSEARGFAPTHLLPTKLDEYPEDVAILSLARRLGLSTRWAADGQRVPGDLRAFSLPERRIDRSFRPEALGVAGV
jgi:flagellar biosynthesis GTPase FlhF